MVKNVKVIATETNEILMETNLENIEEAYIYASKMDQMGIDVNVDAPTLTQTLIDSLGLSLDDKYMYNESVEAEIHDHDGSCCTKESDDTKS